MLFRSWANVLVGLRVDARILCQHVDVGDLDLVEEEETVIHGVVTLIPLLALFFHLLASVKLLTNFGPISPT